MTKQGRLLAKAGKLANLGLTVGGILALLVFLNFFYHYSLTGERAFVRPVDVGLYYVLPLGIAILFLLH